MALALAVLAAALFAGVLIGPVRIPIFGVASEREAAILWQIRIPRVVLGGLVGAALALSGAAYQGVFRNPLADPYLLGSAAGAGLGATLVIAYGPSSLPDQLLPIAAFAGALGGVALAYSLGRAGGGRTAATLILAGVAVAAFLTAIQTFVQQRNDETLRKVYSWILGNLSTAGWKEAGLILPYVLVSSVVIIALRRLMDVMSLGDEESGSLGIRPSRIRGLIVVAASLATAAAVAVSGLIGFVGIIVPHTVRLLAGTTYRRVAPLSFIYGAAFVVAADLIARNLMAPAELPIGVVTAFFGAPFFVLVLRTSRRAA